MPQIPSIIGEQFNDSQQVYSIMKPSPQSCFRTFPLYPQIYSSLFAGAPGKTQNLPFRNISYNGIIQYIVFQVWLLSCNIFEGHPCCSICLYFVPFHATRLSVGLIWFICPPVDGHLDCVQLGLFMNKAVVNIRVKVFAWMCVLSSLG